MSVQGGEGIFRALGPQDQGPKIDYDLRHGKCTITMQDGMSKTFVYSRVKVGPEGTKKIPWDKIPGHQSAKKAELQRAAILFAKGIEMKGHKVTDVSSGTIAKSHMVINHTGGDTIINKQEFQNLLKSQEQRISSIATNRQVASPRREGQRVVRQPVFRAVPTQVSMPSRPLGEQAIKAESDVGKQEQTDQEYYSKAYNALRESDDAAIADPQKAWRGGLEEMRKDLEDLKGDIVNLKVGDDLDLGSKINGIQNSSTNGLRSTGDTCRKIHTRIGKDRERSTLLDGVKNITDEIGSAKEFAALRVRVPDIEKQIEAINEQLDG